MKKDYCSNIDIKKVTNNKTYRKTIKPFLSDKIMSTERITLIDNGDIVSTEQDAAHVLNTFFSNIVTYLEIPEYIDRDPISNNITDLILKLNVGIGIILAQSLKEKHATSHRNSLFHFH